MKSNIHQRKLLNEKTMNVIKTEIPMIPESF